MEKAVFFMKSWYACTQYDVTSVKVAVFAVII